jgi:hypothetical protein
LTSHLLSLRFATRTTWIFFSVSCGTVVPPISCSPFTSLLLPESEGTSPVPSVSLRNYLGYLSELVVVSIATVDPTVGGVGRASSFHPHPGLSVLKRFQFGIPFHPLSHLAQVFSSRRAFFSFSPLTRQSFLLLPAIPGRWSLLSCPFALSSYYHFLSVCWMSLRRWSTRCSS